MPILQTQVNDHQRNALQRNARQRGMTQAEFVRSWLDSLDSGSGLTAPPSEELFSLEARVSKIESLLAGPPQPATDAMAEQKKARALAELQQWQAQPAAIEPEPAPVDPKPSLVREPSAFALQLKAAAEAAKAEPS